MRKIMVFEHLNNLCPYKPKPKNDQYLSYWGRKEITQSIDIGIKNYKAKKKELVTNQKIWYSPVER